MTLVFIYTKILPLSKVVRVTITAIKMKLKTGIQTDKAFFSILQGKGGTLQQVIQLDHNHKPKKNTYIKTTLNRWL